MNEINSKREVFISYHTDSSADVVRKICTTLESAGVSCWYASRNCGSNYASSIVQAIRDCRVFLLILNKYSNMSQHVLNEINCAFDRFKNGENIVLLPYRVDDCTLSDDIYYYLGRIHIMNGSLPPEVTRLQELLDRIFMVLGRERKICMQISEPGTAATPQVKTYQITGSMVYPDNHFSGRKTELAALHEYLSGVENKAALVGMGGIGKSEIAKMFLKQHAVDYDVVLWVPFEDSILATVTNDYTFPIKGLSHADYPQEDDETYFKRKLHILKEIAGKRVLFVIDNFDVPEDAHLSDFCSGSYGVLFTSRFAQDRNGLQEVNVYPLEDVEEMMELFQAEYKRALGNEDIEEIHEILQLLGGHPLSIRLVASTMQSRRLKPAKMLEILQSDTENDSTSAKFTDFIYGRLRQVFDLSDLTELQQHILKNLSLISIRGIEVCEFFELCDLDGDEYEQIDDLIGRNWIIHNPVSDEIHLHPIISELMHEKVCQTPACCDTLVNSLSRLTENTIPYTWERKQMLMDLCGYMAGRLPKGHSGIQKAVFAKAQMYMAVSLYKKALPLYLELIKTCDDFDMKIASYHMAAHACGLSGEYEEQLKIAEEGLRLLPEEELKTWSVQTAYNYNELLRKVCYSYRETKQWDKAVYYARKAIATAMDCPPPGGDALSVMAWGECHLGRVYLCADRLEEAGETLEKSIRHFDECGDDYGRSITMDFAGQVQRKQGNYEKAIEIHEKALDLRKELYGLRHSDTASNYMWRAEAYADMGQKEKAAYFYRQSIQIYEELGLSVLAQNVKNAFAAL